MIVSAHGGPGVSVLPPGTKCQWSDFKPLLVRLWRRRAARRRPHSARVSGASAPTPRGLRHQNPHSARAPGRAAHSARGWGFMIPIPKGLRHQQGGGRFCETPGPAGTSGNRRFGRRASSVNPPDIAARASRIHVLPGCGPRVATGSAASGSESPSATTKPRMRTTHASSRTICGSEATNGLPPTRLACRTILMPNRWRPLPAPDRPTPLPCARTLAEWNRGPRNPRGVERLIPGTHAGWGSWSL